jgi:hypothetical protein
MHDVRFLVHLNKISRLPHAHIVLSSATLGRNVAFPFPFSVLTNFKWIFKMSIPMVEML